MRKTKWCVYEFAVQLDAVQFSMAPSSKAWQYEAGRDKAWQRSFGLAKDERVIGTIATPSDLKLMWRIR